MNTIIGKYRSWQLMNKLPTEATNTRSIAAQFDKLKFWQKSEAMGLLKKFYVEHGYRHKGKILGLFIGAIFSGVIEIFGLIALYMLLRVLINVDSLGPEHFVVRFANIFGVESGNGLIAFLGLGITFTFVFKNIYLMAYYYYQHVTLKTWKTEISTQFMEKYLHAPYSFLLGYNSATIIRNVNNIVNSALNGFVLSGFNFFANIIVTVIILGILYIKYFAITISMGCILIASTIAQNFFLKKKSIELGVEKNKLMTEQSKNVYQGIHSLKETKVIGRENYFLNSFRDINEKTINNESLNLLLTRLPTHLTEIVIIISIVSICAAVLFNHSLDKEASISSLGVLAAIAFRIAPVMNRLLGALQGMNKNLDSMKTMFAELNKLKKFEIFTKDREEIPPMPFESEIRFDNVTYQYPSSKYLALNNVSFSIRKGEFVAIVGESGAGKTTIIDLLLGLISPKDGRIFVDNKSLHKAKIKPWQRNLGYVPQNIYLNDDSVTSNIAFGIDEKDIDMEKVRSTLEQVNMTEVIADMEKGIKTDVGENGKKLSGGQRQRLGIARALYLDSKVLVLDEATSSLDVPTESKIAESILDLKGQKTIVVIAHRLSTIMNADKIVLLSKGEIQDIGSYKELYNRNSMFKNMSDLSHIRLS